MALVLASALFCSCGNSGGAAPSGVANPSSTGTPSDAGTNSPAVINNPIIVYGPGDYDSADTPVLLRMDTDAGSITFLNLDLGKKYTLYYDGTTQFLDKYGNSLTLSQIRPGDLVDLKFVKSKKHLTSMAMSAESWIMEETDQYVMNLTRQEVTIAEDTYKISSDAVFLSDGELIDAMDINELDRLSFQGIGSTVYSVKVEAGHGYLRLGGQGYFVGGWLQVGKMDLKVTEDMLLTVPEGEYRVIISGGGLEVEREVIIEKNRETLLDLSDVEIPESKEGTVLFSLTPSNAQLYIDGEPADTSEPVKLGYGIHQLICRAEGYQTLTQYLNVGQESAGIDIVMEKEKEKTDAVSGNVSTASTSSATSTTTSYYQVHIDAPENVEVYVDGNYVGISPCSFRKVEGTHVITLSKSGYSTRSYTISVDSEAKDVSFSFVNLLTTAEDASN